MRVRAPAKDVRMAPPLLEFIERCLGFALGRFASRVVKVVVRLYDLKGPRGGIDPQCRTHASVGPSARCAVEGKGTSVEEAISPAVDRLPEGSVSRMHRIATTRDPSGRQVGALRVEFGCPR